MKRCVAGILLVLLVPLASAATSVAFRIDMTDEGFLVASEPGVNPVLFVEPGAHVHVNVRNNGTRPQNFHVGAPINVSTPFAQRPGESATLDFDVPLGLEGDVRYFSDGDASKLAGVIRVGTVPPIVRFTLPDADGATVSVNATIGVSVQRFTLDPYPYSTIDQTGRGHLIYLVDGKNASGPTDRTAVTLAHLTPGTHLVRAQLVQHDGAPVEPAAYADRVVRVVADPTPAPATPSSSTTTTPPAEPARGIPGAPVLVALGACVALAIALSSRRRR